MEAQHATFLSIHESHYVAFHTSLAMFHTRSSFRLRSIPQTELLTFILETMGFIIGCVAYIVVCEGICKMLELEDFDKKAWVYAIVGVVGGFIVKSIIAS